MNTPEPTVVPEPTVGRIVHYVARGSRDGIYPRACRAGIVAEVASRDFAGVSDLDEPDPLTIGVAVINPTGMHHDRGVPHAAGNLQEGGTWHWPERDPLLDLLDGVIVLEPGDRLLVRLSPDRNLSVEDLQELADAVRAYHPDSLIVVADQLAALPAARYVVDHEDHDLRGLGIPPAM